jgi:peptide/nickel transport system substrate-binding protein
MKRLIAIGIVVLVLCGLILSGCTSIASQTPSVQVTPSSTSTALPPAQSSVSPPGSSVPASQPPVVSSKYGGTLRWMRDTIPGPGGWPADQWGSTNICPQLCLEGLLRGDNKGNMSPWLAESYKLADDMKSITFNLRKGIKFHDGSDFNAEVAKWNLDNVIAAKTVPYWASVDILDNYTIKVNLTQWSNSVWSAFSEDAYSNMISMAAFNKNGKNWMRQNPVGTGPFKFVSSTPDVSYKVTRNPDYWKKDDQGNQLPYLDGIEILCVVNPLTQEASMKAGEADVLELEPGKIAADLGSAGFIIKIMIGATGCLIPDAANADSPYSKKEVREAVEYAIDREAIANSFAYGFWKAPYQIPGTDSTSYDPNSTLGRKYDPEQAKKLLAQAGYPDGFKTTLLVIPIPMDRNIPVAIQSYLSKVGIDAQIDVPENIGAWLGKTGSIHSMLNLQTFPDYPANFSTTVYGQLGPQSKAMSNSNWPRTDEFVSLLNASLTSPQPDIKLMRAVTDYLVNEALITPVIGSGRSYALSSSVMDGGWYERSVGVYWKPEQTWLNKK